VLFAAAVGHLDPHKSPCDRELARLE